MAEKIIHVSDLSGETAAQEDLARMEVEHPDRDEPIKLEALPTELTALEKIGIRAVVLTVHLPGEEEATRHVVPVDKFDKLATVRPMAEVLADAEPVVAVKIQRRSSHNARTDGGPLINYNLPENAGLHHQGRVGKQESAFVRDNLELVNERRAAAGQVPIDPANPTDAKRYGFVSADTAETQDR
jgi:hypothetical protein